jgi:hypothetical protein
MLRTMAFGFELNPIKAECTKLSPLNASDLADRTWRCRNDGLRGGVDAGRTKHFGLSNFPPEVLR